MARLAAFLRDQGGGALAAVRFQQTFDLAHTEVQLFRRLALFQVSFIECSEDLHSIHFSVAHLENVAYFLPGAFL